MFSRRDPIQPQKVRRNVRTPTTISRMAGSTARQAKAASGGQANLHLEPSAHRGGSPEWMTGCIQLFSLYWGKSPCLVKIMGKSFLTGENRKCAGGTRDKPGPHSLLNQNGSLAH